jgi:hypothetical protein
MPTKKETPSLSATETAVFSAFAPLQRNLKAEDEGVWLSIPDVEEDIEFKIRSADYKPLEDYVVAQLKHWKVNNRNKDVPDEERKRIGLAGIAKFVVLDWRGVKDPSGKEVPFDRDTVVKLFEDPSMSLLANYVRDQSNKAATFKLEIREDAVKN